MYGVVLSLNLPRLKPKKALKKNDGSDDEWKIKDKLRECLLDSWEHSTKTIVLGQTFALHLPNHSIHCFHLCFSFSFLSSSISVKFLWEIMKKLIKTRNFKQIDALKRVRYILDTKYSNIPSRTTAGVSQSVVREPLVVHEQQFRGLPLYFSSGTRPIKFEKHWLQLVRRSPYKIAACRYVTRLHSSRFVSHPYSILNECSWATKLQE